MSRSILRLFALSIACAGGAFAQQGSFAQIAYGGSWQTTFTLLNLSTIDLASVTLSFFGDDGSPLSAPIQGSGSFSTYSFTIPANGAQTVVLAGSNPTVTQGWASMAVATGNVRGQGSFRFLLPGGQISEAVVPLSTSSSTSCIIPLPIGQGGTSAILVPFDNTAGQYVTSLAIANTTNGTLSFSIEFVDQTNHSLRTDTLTLNPKQHVAFVTKDRYQELIGQKGILRISQGISSVTVLGLLSNATNAVTTIIPITQ